MRESISILIPTHNRREILARTLHSLRQLQCPPDITLELVIVANACNDRTCEMIAQLDPPMPFPTRCVEESQVGLNHARNRALREASGDILAFLDDDIWVEPGWLVGLLDVFRNHPADLVAGSVVLWWEAVPRPDWMTSRSEHLLTCVHYGPEIQELKNPGLAVGANLAFRKSVLRQIGPFAFGLDRIGHHPLGGGDTDFVARALAAGLRLFFAPNAAIKHWVAPHRITLEYLCSAAYGNGLARAFLSRHHSAPVTAIIMARQFVRACTYGILQYPARALGFQKAAIHLRIRRMTCRGRYVGAFRRLKGHQPMRSQTQAVPPAVTYPP